VKNKLKSLLENSVSDTFKKIGNKNTGLMYSAGVDSSLLAKVCQDLNFKPTLISLITGSSKDIDYIKKTSQFLNLPLKIHEPNPKDFPEAVETIRKILKKTNLEETLMQVSLGVCIYFACNFAVGEGIHSLISGQGADELFAGYHKFKVLPTSKLQDAINKEIKKVFNVDVRRDSAIAQHFGVTFHTPYLDDNIVQFNKEIPAEYKIRKGQNKYIVRELAKDYGIPNFIAERPKKAMQYSTGIQKLVKRCLKNLPEK